KCFLYCLRRFSRSANEKDPQRFDSVFFDTVGDLTYLRGTKPFLELLQHGIARALGCYSECAKTGQCHCSQQLRRRSRWGEVSGVELDIELSPGNRFADLERMTRWRIECRIDEIKVTDPRLHLQLLYLIGDELRITRTVSPAFDVTVGAVHALVHAATLRLDWNCRPVPLIARQVDPA